MRATKQTQVPREAIHKIAEIGSEVEIYIDADGSVTFADLADDLVDVARRLNPDAPLACEIPLVDKIDDGNQ